jgi:hypothetical protein
VPGRGRAIAAMSPARVRLTPTPRQRPRGREEARFLGGPVRQLGRAPALSVLRDFDICHSKKNRFVKLPSGPHFIDPAGPTIYRYSGNYNKKTIL